MSVPEWWTKDFFNRRLEVNFAASDVNMKKRRDEIVKRLKEHMDVAHNAIMESCTRAYDHHEQIIANMTPMLQMPELVQETRTLCTALTQAIQSMPDQPAPPQQVRTTDRLQHITDTIGVIASQCAYIRNILQAVDLDALSRCPPTIRDLPSDSETSPDDPTQMPTSTPTLGRKNNFHYYIGMSPGQSHRVRQDTCGEETFGEQFSTPSRGLSLNISPLLESSLTNVDLHESQLLEGDSQEMEIVEGEEEIKIINGSETPPAKIKRSAKGSERRTRKSSREKKEDPDYKPSHPVKVQKKKDHGDDPGQDPGAAGQSFAV